MSTYQDELAAGHVGHFGLGVAGIPIASDVFGHFGLGITLGTNFLLIVVDEFGGPVSRGTAYTLEYFNPTTGQTVPLPLIHNPAVPYQATLPENEAITFTLDAGSRYAPSQAVHITIPANGYGIMKVTLAYPAGTVYSGYYRKRYF